MPSTRRVKNVCLPVTWDKCLYDAIVSMGAEEIREIISEQGSIKAECQFCAEQYEFFKEDLDSDLGDQAQTH